MLKNVIRLSACLLFATEARASPPCSAMQTAAKLAHFNSKILMMKRNTVSMFVLVVVCLAAVVIASRPVVKAQNTRHPPQKRTAEIYVQTGHTAPIYSIVFSPDGRMLASGSWDSSIKLSEVGSGREIRSFPEDSYVYSIAFSPDGKTIASGTAHGKLKLWDIASGREIAAFEGHESFVSSVAFSPDGKMIASGSDDATVRLWDVAAGRQLKRFAGHAAAVTAVAFSANGKTLFSSSEDKTVKAWSVVSGRILKTFNGHNAAVESIAISPDDAALVSTSEDGTIKLWDVASGRPLKSFPHDNYGHSIKFSPDGKTFVAADGDIKIYDAAARKQLKILTEDSHSTSRIAYSPDGKTIASVSQDSVIKLWDGGSGKPLRTFAGQVLAVKPAAFSPDGQTFASVSKGASGHTIASTSREDIIKLWDITTGQQSKTLFDEEASNVYSIAFSPDGKTLATGNFQTVILWDVRSGRKIKSLNGFEASLGPVLFSPDGKLLATVNGNIKLWDSATGQLLKTLAEPDVSFGSIAFSPDGRLLASTVSKSIIVWDTGDGRKLRSFVAHTDTVETIAFSPDGNALASGSVDATVKLWDVASGRELKNFSGHGYIVHAVAFSPDGKTIASGSDDGTVKLWNTLSGAVTGSYPKASLSTAREVSAIVPGFYQSPAPDFYSRDDYEPITPDGKFQAKTGESGRINISEVRTGEVLVSLISGEEKDWLATTPDGLFDGTPTAWKQISWRFDNDTFKYAPVEAFFNEFYRPGLLQDILAGRRIEKPVRDISTIDIRQPEVKITFSDKNQSGALVGERQVAVNIEVNDAPADGERQTTGGAKDVRLFRNGSLVRMWGGDVLGGKGSVILTATIPVVAGDNNLTAYAFNSENVKSRDGELLVKGADSLKRKGTAYILAIGVNEYANGQYNLRYAVADAQSFSEELKRRQEGVGIYERVEATLLTNENATKEKIMKALTDLQARTQPEDAVIVYFAGHGTAQGNRFYLIPHDLGYSGDRNKVDAAGLKAMLQHSISDEELEAAFEKIDVGQMLMILDACNSGQALEAEEKRRGPMNSKGLAQLAYEKGMYILTAAQSFQAAQEASQVGHGLLTYALIEEGLKQDVADNEPKDGQIVVREWLDYATARVPRMQVEKMKAARGLGLDLSFKEEERGLEVQQRSGQQPRVFYRRELEQQPLLVAKPGLSKPGR